MDDDRDYGESEYQDDSYDPLSGSEEGYGFVPDAARLRIEGLEMESVIGVGRMEALPL